MAFKKLDRYEELLLRISLGCLAFGHPARLKLIQQMSQQGRTPVKILMREHPLSGPAMSHHLSCLRVEGLSEAEEEYPLTYYSVNLKNLARFRSDLDEFFSGLNWDEEDCGEKE